MDPEDKVIINLCPTGMVPCRAKVPEVPIRPEEIARDVRRCYEAGASIGHLHARADDGTPTWRKRRFVEICQAVVAETPEIVLVVTTSGRNWSELEKRSAALDVDGLAKPEMASLTLGSMNMVSGPSVNSPETIRALIAAMQQRDIVPELEVFDIGMLDYANHLIERGVLKPPYYFNILFGSLGSAAVTAANVAAILSGLPRTATWAFAGIGRSQLSANVLALGLGGHVRVGLEDNPRYDWRSRETTSNPKLVERIVRIARQMGREPATPAQARQIIGLKPVSRAYFSEPTLSDRSEDSRYRGSVESDVGGVTTHPGMSAHAGGRS